jgi:hypothetical protein
MLRGDASFSLDRAIGDELKARTVGSDSTTIGLRKAAPDGISGRAECLFGQISSIFCVAFLVQAGD